MLHQKELRDNEKVECGQLRVERGYTPHHGQKSAEAADSKGVEVFRWCKRVRENLKEKKLELKYRSYVGCGRALHTERSG